MGSLIFQQIGVSSTQEWATDPCMVELTIPESFLSYADACMEFMGRVQNADEINTWNGFDYALYQDAECVDMNDFTPEDVRVGVLDGNKYVPFEPEYTLAGCDVRIDRHGEIKVDLPFKHTSEKVWFSIGNLADLKSKFEQAQAEEQVSKPKMGM